MGSKKFFLDDIKAHLSTDRYESIDREKLKDVAEGKDN